MIHISGAYLTYQDRPILKDIHLSVSAGTALSIVGPSGGGKSTLLKVIAGITSLDAGNVTIATENVSMLFQKNALFDSLTSLENLLFPLRETLQIDGEEAQQRALKMLDAVGLSHAPSLYPDELSGGMQKRLGIARSLIIEPKVILYDEPTAGLDPITSKLIAELIIEQHKILNTTLIMVTNDMQRAYQVSDQIAFIQSGSLTIVGSPTETQNTENPDIRNFIYGIPTSNTTDIEGSPL